MRFIFATNNYRLPADLASGFDDVQILSIVGSYADAIRAMRDADADAPAEAIVLDRRLASTRDRAEGYDVERAAREVRSALPHARLVIISSSTEPDALSVRYDATPFLDVDPERSAPNLGALLGLVDKSEVARVIVVGGYQGGAGKTTMSLAMADRVAERTRGRVQGRRGTILWELDLAHPTIAFNQEIDLISSHGGRRTVARLLNEGPLRVPEDIDKVDEAILPGPDTDVDGAKRKDASGLPFDLLLAPHGAREMMAIFNMYRELDPMRDRLRETLEILKRHYAYIVIDIGTDFSAHPGALVAFENADHICLMTTPTPGGISSILSLQAIVGDRSLNERCRVVINRRKRDDGRYYEAVEEIAGQVAPVIGQIREVERDQVAGSFGAMASRVLDSWGV